MQPFLDEKDVKNDKKTKVMGHVFSSSSEFDSFAK
jgi:hypothetical protein